MVQGKGPTLLFCMWITSCSSAICSRECSYLFECSCTFKKSIGHRCVGFFLKSQFCSIGLYVSHCFDYCSCVVNFEIYPNPVQNEDKGKNRPPIFLDGKKILKIQRYKKAIKKPEPWRIDALKLWCWRRLLRLPLIARSNQSILKEINTVHSLEGLMLKLKLQYFGHLMWRADSWKNDPDAGKDWRQKEKGGSRGWGG